MSRQAFFFFAALMGLLLAPPASATYLDSLVDFERYAETVWHTATATNTPPDSGYFGDGNSSGNGGIRGSCGIAVAYAVLVSALPNDPLRTNRLARIRQALNYAANTHLSGTNVAKNGLKWGRDWQSSLWAGSMGFACKLVESNLPIATVQAVQRAVVDEATYRAGIPPASGYIGDTKAEENGWNANIVSLAAAWLNTHSNAPLWLDSAKKYLVNTYTVANTNSDPLASWITTTTLYPSFALENHGFYHPLYQMVSGMSMADSLMMARLSNTNVANELQPFGEHNVLNVWKHLQHMVLDSGEFAFPSGLDWTLHSFQQNSYYAWLATTFDDPVARQADARLSQLLRYRQIVNGNGSFFTNTEPNVFYMEAVVARRTAFAWLHHEHGNFTNGPTANAPNHVAHFPDIKLITQQGPSGFVSISYGPKIMALIEPPAQSVPTNAFVTTPRSPGIIGLGSLGNPTSAQLITFSTNANGFDAKLLLQNGAMGLTEVYVKTTGDSVAIVEIPTATSPGISAGSFRVGIENHALTGGSRLLEWSGGSATITNRSGISRNVTNDWISVAGRYGVVAGPQGYFNYQAASSYNRAGGAEDTLQFVAENMNGPRYAVWFPGKTTSQTMSNASQINWTASITNAVLTFPGANGILTELFVSLPLPPRFPPYSVPIFSVTASTSQPNYLPTNAIDGNASTFWVSSGSTPGQGPKPSNPEWLKFNFPREVSVKKFQIAPRTFNGGYGPKNVQMLLNGISVLTGIVPATNTLEVDLPQPIHATNAQLLITSSYDPNYPTNSRNVQVVEVVFLERAFPGSFGDWLLARFDDEEIENELVSGANADPDGDGVFNLLEFVTGGNPLVADAENSSFSGSHSTNGNFSLRFTERANLIGVTRQIDTSTNLNDWFFTTPLQERIVNDFGTFQIREVDFSMKSGLVFCRLRYHE